MESLFDLIWVCGKVLWPMGGWLMHDQLVNQVGSGSISTLSMWSLCPTNMGHAK